MATKIILSTGGDLLVDLGVKETYEHLIRTPGDLLQSFHRYPDDALVYVTPAHVVSLEPYPPEAVTPG